MAASGILARRDGNCDDKDTEDNDAMSVAR